MNARNLEAAITAATRQVRGVKPVERTIKLKKQQHELANAIAAEKKVSPLAARVLAARGFTSGVNLDTFLEPTLKDGLDNPDGLKGITEATQLISDYLDSGIGVCCDFDVDGLSGGAQLGSLFNSLGVAHAVFVPDRFEDGYGLNEKMVRQIAERGFKLLICVDYGTTNAKELSLAKKLGLKTLVIDHHHVEGKGPPADVFVNPQQRGCGFAGKTLCAAGLVWYVIMRLRRLISNRATIDPRSFLELACLGTICDLVPLVGTNRVIAKRGLEALSVSTRPGLRAMRQVMGLKGEVSSFDISFGIGPRINAAGRMVNGSSVIEMLTTTDERLALQHAKKLHELNAERQQTEAAVKEAALEMVLDRGALPSGLVVWREDFHTGVIGIVAQRLVELFYRPAIVLGADKDGVYKGSVRGVKGFSVVQALADCGEFLIKHGGHEAAGGLSIHEENLEAFAEAFSARCEERLGVTPAPPVAEADTTAEIGELTLEAVKELRAFAPFGMGNPTPTVLLKGVTVQSVSYLKDTHTKALLNHGNRAIPAFLWRRVDHPLLKQGNKVNVVCKVDVNSFQGVDSVQATLEAVEQC